MNKYIVLCIVISLCACGGGGASAPSSTVTPPSNTQPDPATTKLVSDYLISISAQERALFVTEEHELRLDIARRGLSCGSVEQDEFNALVYSHTNTLTQGLKSYIIQLYGQYILDKQAIRNIITAANSDDLQYFDGFANFTCPGSSNIPAFRQRVAQTINSFYDAMILSLSGYSII